jgi:hypothetical protein
MRTLVVLSFLVFLSVSWYTSPEAQERRIKESWRAEERYEQKMERHRQRRAEWAMAKHATAVERGER